jgi:sugar fermentation stimulation protein A
MIFPKPLIHGKLIKRYKRFLADVILDDGSVVTAHCTNSGSMKSCIEENADVYLTYVDDPKRRTQYTWEMILIDQKWVGINTNHPNALVYEAIKNKELDGFTQYDEVVREVTFGESRLDIMARNASEICAIEVKNVTMKEGDYALFPDARTERGLKHLNTLMRLKGEGLRAVMVYVIQRSDVSVFSTAKEIDRAYAAGLKEAFNKGVEIIPIQVKVTPQSIQIERVLPFFL